MTDDQGRRELARRDPDMLEGPDSAVTPLPDGEARDVERFSAGPRAHSVGLTEERTAQIVRQSASARSWVFLAILLVAIFIPVYWFYESGIPALSAEGRMAAEAEQQYVTDVARGYELYIANCARCHSSKEDPGDGKGYIGPPLNDQAKLYNALTPDLQPGSGHLNPDYIDHVLTVGGRYVCGDPDSLMATWKNPGGPLNYRQVEELIAWLTASKEVTFPYEPESHGEGGTDSVEPMMVAGWRDPNWQPEPGATPPPACWKAPDGLVPAGSAPRPAATPAPVEPGVTQEPITGGTAGEPRVVRVEATENISFKDEDGNPFTQLDVVEGETIEFAVDNTAGFPHNFWIGPPDVLAKANATTDVGIPDWPSGEQRVTWTVEASDAPLQFACTLPGHYQTMNVDIVISGQGR